MAVARNSGHVKWGETAITSYAEHVFQPSAESKFLTLGETHEEQRI